MRTCVDIRYLGIAALVLLGACASLPPDVAVEREPQRTATESQPDRSEPPPGETASEAGVESILAARRRGDYPEIRTDEVGFTITEQVRVPSAARADYEQALILLRQQRYEEGIPLLVAVTERAPELTAPYVDLGIAYRETDDLERAVAVLETAALLSPDHPIVHNELGIVYRKTGRFAEARMQYEKALAVFSDLHFARRNLAVLCDLYLADLECALENYRAYLDSVGEDSEVEIWVADLAGRLERGQ